MTFTEHKQTQASTTAESRSSYEQLRATTSSHEQPRAVHRPRAPRAATSNHEQSTDLEQPRAAQPRAATSSHEQLHHEQPPSSQQPRAATSSPPTTSTTSSPPTTQPRAATSSPPTRAATSSHEQSTDREQARAATSSPRARAARAPARAVHRPRAATSNHEQSTDHEQPRVHRPRAGTSSEPRRELATRVKVKRQNSSWNLKTFSNARETERSTQAEVGEQRANSKNGSASFEMRFYHAKTNLCKKCKCFHLGLGTFGRSRNHRYARTSHALIGTSLLPATLVAHFLSLF